MTTSKWTINTGEQHDLLYLAKYIYWNGVFAVWGGDTFRVSRAVLSIFLTIELWWANKKYKSTNWIIFITLFLCTFRVLLFPLPATLNSAPLGRAKTNFLSQTSIFWLFFIQLYCAGSRTTEHLSRSSKQNGYDHFDCSFQHTAAGSMIPSLQMH
jgi:hypothetical protein